MDQETLRKLQLMKMESLHEIERICEKHGLRYFLNYGTLLGAIRHGGYIPWDDDIDLCMLPWNTGKTSPSVGLPSIFISFSAVINQNYFKLFTLTIESTQAFKYFSTP